MKRNRFEYTTALQVKDKNDYCANKARDYIKGVFPKTVGELKALLELVESNCMVDCDTEIHFSFNGETEFELWFERDFTLDEFHELG